MLFAPIATRILSAAAAAGLLLALPGCSSGFDVGGCTSPDDIRRGVCTPANVDPDEHYSQGLSCMSVVGATFWPGQLSNLAGGNYLAVEHIPDYDPDAKHQRWACSNPESAY